MHMFLINILFLFYPLTFIYGQESGIAITNQISDPRIKTVQIYREGWNLSYPIITLGSNEKLMFQFDLIGDRDEAYNYTFIHCDKDWIRSDIFVNDYLEGFPENLIEDIKASFNTTLNYFHYTLAFPNDRINIKLSGNYILNIYQPETPEKPVITQRFIIKEDAAKVDMMVHRPQMSADKDAGQQVDFTVDLTGAGIIDPYRNIYCSLLQNGRWDNAKNNLKPDIYGGNELKYNSLSEKNIFIGGNEFRYFDIKSIKYQSENVRRIDFMAPYYHVYLAPSENREFKPYFYLQDFNGKYYIAAQEGMEPETDADYLYVYFTLPSKYMIEGGDMYVSGNLSNWSFGNDNRMTYNPERGQYECTMLLKQGWYNYEYVFLKDGMKTGVATKFEGSHYETENDYTSIVYYRNPRGRYDMVIGTGSVNTLNRISY
ncbi:MAG: DUF5103 domain-containing protein [Bacteroidales bacterium]|nr:DUF5103 domain-containing protein [Bacteroidales bacterium]